MKAIEAITSAIRDVPGFPKAGIVFKDITPVLADPEVFRLAVALFVERHLSSRVGKVAGIEARGFIFGAAVAHELGVGFIPVRKKGKLPAETVEATYELEYGTATVEIHKDVVARGERVLLLDDLLATGGTAAATIDLLEELGAEVVEADFLIELAFLNGREKLARHEVFAPITY